MFGWPQKKHFSKNRHQLLTLNYFCKNPQSETFISIVETLGNVVKMDKLTLLFFDLLHHGMETKLGLQFLQGFPNRITRWGEPPPPLPTPHSPLH